MPPAIDPFTPKNQDLEPGDRSRRFSGPWASGRAPRRRSHLHPGGRDAPAGSSATATLLQEETLPDGAKVVLQVSRWDRLKDPRGLLECFIDHVQAPNAHLVLAGPDAGAVSDDPEGEVVYGDVAETWRRLPEDSAAGCIWSAFRCTTPTKTVRWSMRCSAAPTSSCRRAWPRASASPSPRRCGRNGPWSPRGVGGIQDQIVDGESGLLVDDPHDLEAFGAAIDSLLRDPELAARLGAAAHDRVRDRFLAVGRLAEYVALVTSLTSSRVSA